jgi:hypothetical protein
MKKLLVVCVIVLFLGVAIAPSINANNGILIEEKSLLPIAQGTINEKLNVKYKELDFLLRFYRLNIGSTIGEFKQLLYRLATNRENRNPLLTVEFENDIEKLSNLFYQIGASNDLTIKQALPLIENNSEVFQEEGINLFCSIHILGFPGGGRPWIRLFKVLYGEWNIWEAWGENYVIIKSKILGCQICENQSCEETSGKFIGLITFTPPAMYWTYMIITPHVFINGFFTLFSISNVPYVYIDNASQQSKCPCY